MEMQGSIANELYSDILQSSSVELGRESTTIKANGNLHESDSDDWCEEGSICEDSVSKSNEASNMEREWQKRRNQFHTIGYRDGLMAGKEAAAQEGFNIGFKDSVFTGYKWGLVRGITSAMACLPAGIKVKLIESEETRKKFELLHESVQHVLTSDALRLFYGSYQRNLENQESNELSSTTIDSNLQRGSTNVLENYHRELHSLLTESRLLEGSLKID